MKREIMKGENNDDEYKHKYPIKFEDEGIVEAQRAAAGKKWRTLVEIFEGKKDLLLESFDVFGNTAIHAVARAGEAGILRELLQMLPSEQVVKGALRKPNSEGNTLLHEVALNDFNIKQMISTLDTIMEFAAQDKFHLLEIQNDELETPLSRAARFGNLRFLNLLQSKHRLSFQSDIHFPERIAGHKIRPVLHSACTNLKFEVAVWLLENVDVNLAKQKFRIEGKDKGVTCLQLLSRMQMAFKTKDIEKLSSKRKFIYHMLPDMRYDESEVELDDAGTNSFKNKQDLEYNQARDEAQNPSKSVFSSINYAFWKLVAKGLYCVPEIWKQKDRHKSAENLAKLLIKHEDSWKQCGYIRSWPLGVSPKYPPNVTETKKEIELNDLLKKKMKFKNKLLMEEDLKKRKLKKNEEDIPISKVDDNGTRNEEDWFSKTWGSPAFMAAVYGNIEVVKMIVDKYPEAISHVNDEGYNILHLAIKHRQLDIYDYLENSPAFTALLARITIKDGRTILHQAATMEYYREPILPGVAYQLQDELDWYHRVRSVLPDHYLMHVDKEGLTAGDRLDIEHAEMHAQAKEWMKETAQSCSTVAVLIAGVVFAAAYAIPGGTQNGRPALKMKNPAFRVFTVMDVVALACSLGSVVMFLSILTSSFDLWDFHKSLPRKLRFGFILLFIALITTMLAFAATILLTIRLEGNKTTTTFTYSLAFVIVSIFGLTQFPLYKMTEDMIKTCVKFWKKFSRPFTSRT